MAKQNAAKGAKKGRRFNRPRSDKAKRERDERHRELVRKLGDIEFQLKLTKDSK